MQYINVGKGKIRLVEKCKDMPCKVCKYQCKDHPRKTQNEEVKSKVIKLKGVK